jgi:predicted  nucleic acid-binding Zn-ribbon protein
MTIAELETAYEQHTSQISELTEEVNRLKAAPPQAVETGFTLAEKEALEQNLRDLNTKYVELEDAANNLRSELAAIKAAQPAAQPVSELSESNIKLAS